MKPSGQSSSPPPEDLAGINFSAVVIPPPAPAQFATDSPIKKQFPPFGLSKNAPPLAKAALAPLGGITPYFDKENAYNPPGYGPKAQTQYESVYGNKAPLKRTLMEAAPLTEKSTNKKHKKSNSATLPKPAVPSFYDEVPAPASQGFPDAAHIPMPRDDGTKPPFSYAQLIGMAILRSPNHRLTLAQIYKWISDSYSFYRQAETGWQNSIRHNLSLNKAFDKKERPKDDPGKGNYWVIKPGNENQFLKDKPRRNTNTDSGTFIVHGSDSIRTSTGPSVSFHGPSTISTNIDSSKFPDEAELSSDATIPASDTAHEGVDADFHEPHQFQNIRSSPPPADIMSSPPPGLSQQTGREATPPPVPRLAGNSRSGGRKRKLTAAGLGDSGYYSSIESSVTRGCPPLLTSDADIENPAKRRGRAEEEIARIRGSSYDSPSKTGVMFKPLSSSPFHPFENFKTKTPLTPPVIFKKPARPVVSVSPNTNLRNHRDNVKRLLGSPLKEATALPPLSPLDTEAPNPSNFELFHDDNYNFDDFFEYVSPLPEKRSSKRPRLERASTTIGFFAGVSGNGNTGIDDIPSPYRFPKADLPIKMGRERFKLLDSPGRIWPSPTKNSKRADTPEASPSKSNGALSIPTLQLPPEDEYLFGVELPSDSSEPGFDITQSFQKIGAPTGIAPEASSSLAPPPSWSRRGSPTKQSKQNSGMKPTGRPAFGRSATTMF